MSAPAHTKIIRALDEAAKGDQNLLCALLLLLALFQHPSSYPNKKSRPSSAYRDMVRWALLAFEPLAGRLTSRGRIDLPDGMSATRVLCDDGSFKLVIDGLFPDTPNEAAGDFEFDVCLSFAGEQRELAECLAFELRDTYHLKVFYDDFQALKLWGHDLYKHLYDVYSRRSRLCVILFSDAYLRKNWTTHELRAAQSRALKERTAYVLPVLVETVEVLPQEFENISYLKTSEKTLEQLAEEVNERVWSEKGKQWLTEEEVYEALNDDLNFQVFFARFRDRIAELSDEDDKLRTFILALAWCCDKDGASNLAAGIVKYLLFTYPGIADHFNQSDQLVVFPPDGAVLRVANGNDGSLRMQQAFWAPILESAALTDRSRDQIPT